MNIRFDCKRALVTGAGKGIGRGIAILLARCGATLIGLSSTVAELIALRERFGDEMIVADLASADTAQAAALQTGRVDVLVNSVGISVPPPFLKMTVAEFDTTHDDGHRRACRDDRLTGRRRRHDRAWPRWRLSSTCPPRCRWSA